MIAALQSLTASHCSRGPAAVDATEFTPCPEALAAWPRSPHDAITIVALSRLVYRECSHAACGGHVLLASHDMLVADAGEGHGQSEPPA